MKRIFAALLLVSIASTTSRVYAAEPSLSAVKKAIVVNKDEIFKDPDSIRGAKIGQPGPCPSRNGKTCVCVGLNARNAYGGMAGYHVIGMYVTGNHAESFGEMSDTKDCGTMQPFPQLNGKRS